MTSEERLYYIRAWLDAYPLEAFPDQDLKLADKVLKRHGISMGAMHGQWARHIVSGLRKIAGENEK